MIKDYFAPMTVAERLRREALSDNELDRASAARNPDLPKELFRRLAQDGERVQVALAGNPACPPEVLARLARSRSTQVRATVAQHPACPKEALLRLLRDRWATVRMTALENPQLSLRSLIASFRREWAPLLKGKAAVRIAQKMVTHPPRKVNPKLWFELWEYLPEEVRAQANQHPKLKDLTLLARLGE